MNIGTDFRQIRLIKIPDSVTKGNKGIYENYRQSSIGVGGTGPSGAYSTLNSSDI